MSKQNKNALNKFVKINDDIKNMVSKLQNLSDDHFDRSPEDIDWGNVGDLSSIAKGIEETLLLANAIDEKELKYSN